MIFHFEISCCCKIIFIFGFEFSLFPSELEYRMQTPLGYQGSTDQTQRLAWAELLLVLSPPCIPLPKSICPEFGRSLRIDPPCHQSMFLFLLSGSDSTSFCSCKESGLIFFWVIRNVLLSVHFENCI